MHTGSFVKPDFISLLPWLFLTRFSVCEPFLKSLLNLLQYCFCFLYLFFCPRGMWDLSSPTREWTFTPRIQRRSLNHWTTRRVPAHLVSIKSFTQIARQHDSHPQSPGLLLPWWGSWGGQMSRLRFFFPPPSVYDFEQTPGDGERQGSLKCCSPWGCKESDTTERLNTSAQKVQKGIKVKGRRSGYDSRPRLTLQSWRGPHSGNSPISSKSIQVPKDRTRGLWLP